MNPGPLILLAYCLTGFAALGCLCLAMPRNSRCFDRSLPQRTLRWCGWSLVAFLIIFALAEQGLSFGLVSVSGALSFSTFVIVSLLTYQPRWLLPGTPCSALAGLLLLGISVLTVQP